MPRSDTDITDRTDLTGGHDRPCVSVSERCERCDVGPCFVLIGMSRPSTRGALGGRAPAAGTLRVARDSHERPGPLPAL